MIDSLSNYTVTNATYSQGKSLYQEYFEKFSALLAEEQELQSSQKREILATEEGSIDNPIQITKASEPASAYLSQTSSWSLETHGSHKVNGIELVPGAPSYDATLASSYHQEIALSDVQRITGNTSSAVDLASVLQTIDTPQTKTNTLAIETLSTNTNPPSAYVATNTPWSLETHGSHIVNGIQLIPGAPGYNAALASPYHQEIAQTNALFNS